MRQAKLHMKQLRGHGTCRQDLCQMLVSSCLCENSPYVRGNVLVVHSKLCRIYKSILFAPWHGHNTGCEQPKTTHPTTTKYSRSTIGHTITGCVINGALDICGGEVVHNNILGQGIKVLEECNKVIIRVGLWM